jgi:hypothetical protein
LGGSASAKHTILLLKNITGIFKGVMTFRITTLSIKVLRATLSIITICITTQYDYAKCNYPGRHILLIVMQNAIMLSVVMLNVIMLNVTMLSVDMLNVFMISVVMLNVVMQTVITLSFIMLNVVMGSVFMLIVVILNVVAPF